MSRAVAAQDGCAAGSCVDDGYVTVRFSNGAERDYCPFHAEHVLAAVGSAEVVR